VKQKICGTSKVQFPESNSVEWQQEKLAAFMLLQKCMWLHSSCFEFVCKMGIWLSLPHRYLNAYPVRHFNILQRNVWNF